MFTLKISTANEAFDDEGPEIARILRHVAAEIVTNKGRTLTKDGNTIRDHNGKTVGKWELAANGAQVMTHTPELLDFARNVAGIDEHWLSVASPELLRRVVRNLRDEARDAIAKAEGKS